jgi:hypothetical protein
VTKYLRLSTYKEKKFSLVHHFRDFKLWSVGFLLFWACAEECMMDPSCSPHDIQESETERREGSNIPLKDMNPTIKLPSTSKSSTMS